MSKYSIVAVPTTMVDLLWHQMEQFIQLVVDVSHDEITCDSVKSAAKAGDLLLVPICDGPVIIAVNVLEIRTFESGKKVLCIPVVGGTNMMEWKDEFLTYMHSIARDFGCTELRGFAG